MRMNRRAALLWSSGVLLPGRWGSDGDDPETRDFLGIGDQGDQEDSEMGGRDLEEYIRATPDEKRRKRNFAFAMEHEMVQYEIEVAAEKRRVFSDHIRAEDRVVEVGLGTGPNLWYYPSGVKVLGIEPNRYMDSYAIEKANQLDLLSLEIYRGSIEQTAPELQGKFDVAVSTLTLCSVHDPVLAVRNIAAMLKSGGKFIFLEHVVSTNPVLEKFQTICDPLQARFSDGCSLTRRTGDIIEHESSFRMLEMKRFRLKDLGAILISPHILGVARKV
uniref:Methyltransferase type 11 domain-containing protein n=1 Tax=Compsopogon caeruleus TaxID=31354 RepID=A0A7S1XF98_9RHOD